MCCVFFRSFILFAFFPFGLPFYGYIIAHIRWRFHLKNSESATIQSVHFAFFSHRRSSHSAFISPRPFIYRFLFYFICVYWVFISVCLGHCKNVCPNNFDSIGFSVFSFAMGACSVRSTHSPKSETNGRFSFEIAVRTAFPHSYTQKHTHTVHKTGEP